MRPPNGLVRLPRRLDLRPLAAALETSGEADWLRTPRGALGDHALPLVSAGGTANLDYALAGPARPTRALRGSAALQESLAALGGSVARSRLVRLAPGTSGWTPGDWTWHAYDRTTAVVAVRTSPSVSLRCDGERVHPAAGEVWLLDTARPHGLDNPSGEAAVHLLVEARDLPGDPTGPLSFEPYRFDIPTPVQLSSITAALLGALAARGASPVERADAAGIVADTRERWARAFARHGSDPRGELAYRDVLLDACERLRPFFPGSAPAPLATLASVLTPSPPAPRRLHRPRGADATRRPSPPAGPGPADRPGPTALPTFDRPIFVVSAPRSGSTLLFDLLSRARDAWTIGGESHAVLRAVPSLHPAARGYASDRLTAAEATREAVHALTAGFAERLCDRDGEPWAPGGRGEAPAARGVRFLEKTPANALRIPFLDAAYPGACFVYLRRDARETVSSLVEGWRSGRFVAYRDLPGWPHREWSFLLPPGWADLADRPLVEIAAWQWRMATEAIEADLSALPPTRWREVAYEDLVARPRPVLTSIADFVGLELDPELERAVAGPLAPSRVTLSAPAPEKWRRHEAELEALFPAGGPGVRANRTTRTGAESA